MHKEEDAASFNADFDALKLSGSTALQELTVITTHFKTATNSCGQALRQSQEGYEQLLAKYAALKSRCGDGEAPEDTVVNEGVTDAYVVVLIDAHSHRFKGSLMCDHESGGSRTAKLLKEAVATYIADACPGEQVYRIDARVYANFKNLSLEVVDVCDARNPCYEKLKSPRALGAFAAGFSRDEVFFDFVDVADERAVEKKIMELFKRYVKDPQCKHVLLGASGSSTYVRVLKEHLVFLKKVTVIQRGPADTSLVRVDLEVTQFVTRIRLPQ